LITLLTQQDEMLMALKVLIFAERIKEIKERKKPAGQEQS